MSIKKAEALLSLLESDFGQSGRDVRIEAIRCELAAAEAKGREEERERCIEICGEVKEEEHEEASPLGLCDEIKRRILNYE